MSVMDQNDKIMVYVKSMIKLMRNPSTKELQKKDDTEFMKLMQEKYHQLHFKYPSLFNMVIEDGDKFDIPKLQNMLSMKQKVDSNEVSNHDASVQVGTEEYNNYVKDKVAQIK
jgi:hypothetical protein